MGRGGFGCRMSRAEERSVADELWNIDAGW